MTALAAPWALLALLSIPVLIWLHRRRRRGVPVDVPSLLFLEGEDVDATAPERRRFDAELALAIAAAACLSFAAAGPRVALGAPKPVVRVVLDASPAMDAHAPGASSPREKAEAALESLGLTGSIVRARGDGAALVAAARREPADVRIVVSDRAITPAPADVHVAAYGDPATESVGIVAVHVALGDANRRAQVFATLWNHSPRERRFTLNLGEQVSVLTVPADGAASTTVDPREATLEVIGGGAVELSAMPLVAHIDDGLPSAHRRAVEDALVAVLGRDGFSLTRSPPELWIGRADQLVPGDAFAVVLDPLRAGETGIGVSGTADDSLDPVLSGVDASGSERLARPSLSRLRPLPLVRKADGPMRSPVKFSDGPSYEWVADPLAGSPSPVDTPAWPVFWANVVASLRGDDVGGGWRAKGLLALDDVRLGRDQIPIDPAWIAAAKPAPPEPKDLRLPLIVGGALCMLLLWFAPRGRRLATVT